MDGWKVKLRLFTVYSYSLRYYGHKKNDAQLLLDWLHAIIMAAWKGLMDNVT